MTAEQAIISSPTHDYDVQRPLQGKPHQSPAAQPLLDPLSERELEVLQLVASGASNQEIALALVLALGTIKLHVSHILSKLGVNSRTQAILRARELGLLPDEHIAS
jgi:LuxR family maltose regulon positive regulatory protein